MSCCRIRLPPFDNIWGQGFSPACAPPLALLVRTISALLWV
jgi:hypothetical protein